MKIDKIAEKLTIKILANPAEMTKILENFLNDFHKKVKKETLQGFVDTLKDIKKYCKGGEGVIVQDIIMSFETIEDLSEE